MDGRDEQSQAQQEENRLLPRTNAGSLRLSHPDLLSSGPPLGGCTHYSMNCLQEYFPTARLDSPSQPALEKEFPESLKLMTLEDRRKLVPACDRDAKPLHVSGFKMPRPFQLEPDRKSRGGLVGEVEVGEARCVQVSPIGPPKLARLNEDQEFPRRLEQNAITIREPSLESIHFQILLL